MKNSSFWTFIASLLLFLSFSFQFSAQKPRCHPQDQKAIDQIQAAFGINPTGDCCDWNPVIVCAKSPPYRVTQFFFQNGNYANVSGEIPAAVGDLSFLRILVFDSVSNLTGNIPTAITKLSQLRSLVVKNARLSGPVPNFLVQLKNLGYLDLSSNALTGSIPPNFSQLRNLNSIYLQNNKLTGTIPESYGFFNKKKFQVLNLGSNFLTGTIPKSLGNLNLIILDLSNNNFIGDASFLFNINNRNDDLYLQGNKLKFNLSKVEFPQGLVHLDLSHNNIYGSLPQQLSQLVLFQFNVSYNQLCGVIPQSQYLQGFGVDAYFHNKCLCGAPLPPCK